MAAIANLLVDQGATFTTTVTVYKSDDSIYNLTNYTAAAQVRKSHASSAKTDFATAISTPANGQITLTLTKTQTAALEEGTYVYDVEITASDSTVTRVVQGVIKVSPNVTR
tara:strand:- start:57 stop:389 length:333 start_codon:yes stop_codon:yes gene_type:complete